MVKPPEDFVKEIFVFAVSPPIWKKTKYSYSWAFQEYAIKRRLKYTAMFGFVLKHRVKK